MIGFVRKALGLRRDDDVARRKAKKGADPGRPKRDKSSRKAAQSYGDRVMSRLDGGRTHATLGPKLKAGSAEAAQRFVARLVDLGMRSDHVVVDYGCGTLRIGAFLIDFLEPDRYFGLDLEQRFLDMGLSMLPAGLAERKRPTLRVISDASIASVAEAGPDWIFSKGVVQHVPPEGLGTFFGNIHALARRQTNIEIQAYKLADTPVQISRNTWSHSPKELEKSIQAAGLEIKSFKDRGDSSGFFLLRKAG